MKRTRRILVLAAVAVLIGLVYYLYGGAAVPTGQRPLISLNAGNFDQLFAAAVVTVISLVSIALGSQFQA